MLWICLCYWSFIYLVWMNLEMHPFYFRFSNLKGYRYWQYSLLMVIISSLESLVNSPLFILFIWTISFLFCLWDQESINLFYHLTEQIHEFVSTFYCFIIFHIWFLIFVSYFIWVFLYIKFFSFLKPLICTFSHCFWCRHIEL